MLDILLNPCHCISFVTNDYFSLTAHFVHPIRSGACPLMAVATFNFLVHSQLTSVIQVVSLQHYCLAVLIHYLWSLQRHGTATKIGIVPTMNKEKHLIGHVLLAL